MMKSRLKFAVLVIFMGVEPVFGQSVEKTIKLTPTGSITFIKAPKKGGTLKVIGSEAMKNAKEFKFPVNSTLTLSDYMDKTRAMGVVSGGYLASFAPPTSLGFVKISGDVISRKITTWVGGGLFCTNGQKSFIGEFNLDEANNFSDCLQSGPLIIKNGQDKYSQNSDLEKGERRLLRDDQEHSFICKNNVDEVVFGVSSAMKLSDFSKALLEELKCQNALRLSGGATSGLAVGKKIFGNDDLPLSMVIAVFK